MASNRGKQTNRPTTVNGLLKSVTVVTLLLSFTALIVGGYWIFENKAPTPLEVIGAMLLLNCK